MSEVVKQIINSSILCGLFANIILVKMKPRQQRKLTVGVCNEWHSIIFGKLQFYWNLIIIIITIISYLFSASLRVTQDTFSGRPVVRRTIIIRYKNGTRHRGRI
jgi:hypothetical protein